MIVTVVKYYCKHALPLNKKHYQAGQTLDDFKISYQLTIGKR